MVDLLEALKAIEEDIIGWRRDLHRIPELGLELEKTSGYIGERLVEMGIEYRTYLEGQALVAQINSRRPGRILALRADMDGLPLGEETGLAFQAENGNMHACGHDAHMAILLGVGKILNENKDSFQGGVRLIFQPGEEYPGGAQPLIGEGVLDQPRVDAILGLHSGQLSKEVPPGSIGISYGDLMASMDRFLIRVEGRGGHGAYPELTIDPIITAAELVTSLQKIVSRELASHEKVVFSICRINGGFNQNIIPDQVELEGTVRTFDNRIREQVARRAEEITRGICLANGASYHYSYDFKYPALRNDRDFTQFFRRSAEKILAKDKIVEIKKPLMSGEDFAYYLEEVPGCFFFLSNMREVDGKIHPHHSPKFDIDERGLLLGAQLMIQASLDFLSA